MNAENRPMPLAEQIYRHFKGNKYQIVCIAFDSETGDKKVVYQALYDDHKYYVRDYDMFMSPVDRVKYPDADQEYRFELITEDEMSLDPQVEKFLDADTYEERIEILTRMEPIITDDMIDIMSTVLDIEIAPGRTSQRYDKFKDALMMRRQFETGRLR